MKRTAYKFGIALILAAVFAFPGPAGAADFTQLVSFKAGDIPAVTGPAAEVSFRTILPEIPVQRAVQPGTSILPAISDQGRVQGILSLISKIYKNVPLRFPPHDGSIFTNTENVLPRQARDFYKEYTFIPPPHSPGDITIGGKPFHVSPPIGKRGADKDNNRRRPACILHLRPLQEFHAAHYYPVRTRQDRSPSCAGFGNERRTK